MVSMPLNELLSQPEFRLSVHAFCASATGTWMLCTKRKIAPYVLGYVIPAMVTAAVEVPAMHKYSTCEESTKHLLSFLAVGYAPIFPALYVKSRRDEKEELKKKD